MGRPWDDCGLTLTPVPLPSPVGGTERFMEDLALACRHLGSTRLRCSLFAIRPAGIGVRVALARLTARFERLGPVGMLADDHIGFLLLDRGHSSERNDNVFAALIERQAADALAPGTARHFVALHYWADEMSDAEDLVWRLEDRAFRRSPTLIERAAASARL